MGHASSFHTSPINPNFQKQPSKRDIQKLSKIELVRDTSKYDSSSHILLSHSHAPETHNWVSSETLMVDIKSNLWVCFLVSLTVTSLNNCKLLLKWSLTCTALPTSSCRHLPL
jgi:hypothetical protein